MNYKVELSHKDLQTILTCLIKEPYINVFNIVNKIQTQIQNQVEIKQEVNESDKSREIHTQ